MSTEVLRCVHYCKRKRRVQRSTLLEVVVSEGITRAQAEEEGAKLGSSEGNSRRRGRIDVGETALVLTELVYWTPRDRTSHLRDIKTEQVLRERFSPGWVVEVIFGEGGPEIGNNDEHSSAGTRAS